MPLPLSREDKEWSWPSANPEEGHPQTPDLPEFPTSNIVRNKLLMLKPPRLWPSVLAVRKGPRHRRKSGSGDLPLFTRIYLLSCEEEAFCWALCGTARMLGSQDTSGTFTGSHETWGASLKYGLWGKRVQCGRRHNDSEAWVHLGKRSLRYRQHCTCPSF